MIDFCCRLRRRNFVFDMGFSGAAGCVALFGPSGSGKTTIAKLIAGLDTPDYGRIIVAGRVLLDTGAGINIPVHKRRIGFVFQDGQLLPHLSVRSNLKYARHFSRGEELAPLDEILGILGIRHLLDARPATLSGGERQRVAIGRALLAAPDLLVLDEPLASLDRARRLEILPFIERLRDELMIPIVYVSHSVEEVARLATVVVRIGDGRVLSQGPPQQVLTLTERSNDRFEASSFLLAKCSKEASYDLMVLEHQAGSIYAPGRLGQEGETLRLRIRATNVSLSTEKPVGLSIRTQLRGKVSKVEDGPDLTALVTIELDGGDEILASITRLAVNDLQLRRGREVYALIKAVSIDEAEIGSFSTGQGRRL